VHDPEKWKPVFRKDHAPLKMHDPEKLALGRDPRVEAGFPKSPAPLKRKQRQSFQSEAIALRASGSAPVVATASGSVPPVG
jgi:hypothetical protein